MSEVKAKRSRVVEQDLRFEEFHQEWKEFREWKHSEEYQRTATPLPEDEPSEWTLKVAGHQDMLDVLGVQLPVIDCAGCGACCRHMKYPHFLFPSDPDSGVPLICQHLTHRQFIKKLRRLLRQETNEGVVTDAKNFLALPDAVQRDCLTAIRLGAGMVDDHYPCVWLDEQTRKCLHYENRPNECRIFQAGSLHCLDYRLDAREEGLLK
jgi:Fe-S-cluster containining protein